MVAITVPQICPMCEGASMMSSNHSCKAYYDDLQKRSVTTTSQTVGGTIQSNIILSSPLDQSKLPNNATDCGTIPPNGLTMNQGWKSMPYIPNMGIQIPQMSGELPNLVDRKRHTLPYNKRQDGSIKGGHLVKPGGT